MDPSYRVPTFEKVNNSAAAKGRTTEYLVRFVSYGPEDDLWLPEKNLVHAPDILKEYHDSQKDTQQPTLPCRQLSACKGHAPRPLTRN
eukprot:2638318-Rhodomonas_salina.1